MLDERYLAERAEAETEEARALVDLYEDGTFKIPGVDAECNYKDYMRVSFDVTIENTAGQSMQYRFIGTTHELDLTADSSALSTQAEKDFVSEQLAGFEGGYEQLLVEQGEWQTTQNNVTKDIQAFIASNPEAHAWYMSTVANQSGGTYNPDMAVTGAKVAKKKLPVVNIDLAMNPAMFEFIETKLGTEEMLESATEQVASVLYNEDPKWVAETVIYLLKKYLPDNSVTSEHVHNYVKTHLSTPRPRPTPKADGLRDEFMAQQILLSDKPSVVAAHTGHVAAILGILNNNIRKMALVKQEIAEEAITYRIVREKFIKDQAITE